MVWSGSNIPAEVWKEVKREPGKLWGEASREREMVRHQALLMRNGSTRPRGSRGRVRETGTREQKKARQDMV